MKSVNRVLGVVIVSLLLNGICFHCLCRVAKIELFYKGLDLAAGSA